MSITGRDRSETSDISRLPQNSVTARRISRKWKFEEQSEEEKEIFYNSCPLKKQKLDRVYSLSWEKGGNWGGIIPGHLLSENSRCNYGCSRYFR